MSLLRTAFVAVLLGTAVLAASVRCAHAAPASQQRPARDEANLVVTRFLVASALGDRRTACRLYPTLDSCRRSQRLFGPTHFRILTTRLANAGQAVVRAEVGAALGTFVLERTGASFTIVAAPEVPTTHHPSNTPAADLVVTRFLVAAALGDRTTACALYPSYFLCMRGQLLAGSANFQVVSTTLAVPTKPAVFANIDGVRGYFVLQRNGRSLVIASAGLD